MNRDEYVINKMGSSGDFPLKSTILVLWGGLFVPVIPGAMLHLPHGRFPQGKLVLAEGTDKE